MEPNDDMKITFSGDTFKESLKNMFPGRQSDREIDQAKMELAMEDLPVAELPLAFRSLERLADVYPMDVDLYDMLAFRYERLGFNRYMISANEMYARSKGDVWAAESLAAVDVLSPPTIRIMLIVSTFQFKALLDEYRDIPVLVTMEAHALSNRNGIGTFTIHNLSNTFPGRVQPMIVHLDATKRVGETLNVKIRPGPYGAGKNQGSTVTIMMIHDGLVVMRREYDRDIPEAELRKDIRAYLDHGTPIDRQPVRFETHQLFTSGWRNPCRDDPDRFWDLYPVTTGEA